MSDTVPLIVWIIAGAVGGWLLRIIRQRGAWSTFIGWGVMGGFLGGFAVTCMFNGTVTPYTLPGALVGSLVLPPIVEYVEKHHRRTA